MGLQVGEEWRAENCVIKWEGTLWLLRRVNG